MEWYQVGHYFEQSSTHFALGFFVGLIVFCLTLTMCYAVFRGYRGTVLQVRVLKISILGLGLVSAFIAAYFAHVLLDAFSDWWVTPLGLPMTIIK